MEEFMSQRVSHLEEVIVQFRHLLPAISATAQAIDRHEPWRQIAMRAVDDGYIKSVEQFFLYVEVCLEFGEYPAWLLAADEHATRH
jgi:hypothetical protein